MGLAERTLSYKVKPLYGNLYGGAQTRHEFCGVGWSCESWRWRWRGKIKVMTDKVSARGRLVSGHCKAKSFSCSDMIWNEWECILKFYAHTNYWLNPAAGYSTAQPLLCMPLPQKMRHLFLTIASIVSCKPLFTDN
jgi:hypothetical protein